MTLPEHMRAILVCPKCKQALVYQQQPEALICEKCRLLYAVENDIPNMLLDEAQPWDEQADNRPNG